MGWLKKRTNLEKTLLSLSCLLFLTLLLMILIGITFHGDDMDTSYGEDEICWNADCIKAAGEVISSIEPTTNSCSNFYGYACGKYGLEPGQTVSVARRSTDSVYFTLKKIMESNDRMNVSGLDEIKSFYDSCVKFGSHRQDAEETGESLLNLMTAIGIGVWPIIDSLYDTSRFSLEHTLSSLSLLDVPVVFRMEVEPDELLAGSYLIKISPGGPRETGRSPSDIRSDVHLRSSVLTSFLLLGSSAANTDVYDILSVDSSFAAIEQDKTTPCEDVTTLAPVEVMPELNRYFPEMNWTIILSDIQRATGLRRPFAVKLVCRQKIRDYVVHLNDLTVRSETNYLGWRFFSKYVEHVIPTFEKVQFGTDEGVPRWRVCLELTEKFASPILEDLLVQKIITKGIREEVEKISNAALSVTQRLVSRTTWLDEGQKTRIAKKVEQIRMRYPFQKRATKDVLQLNIPKVDVHNFTAVVIERQRQWVIEKFRRLNQESEQFNSNATESWIPMLSARSNNAAPPDYTIFVYFDKIVNPYIRLQGSKWLNSGGFGVFIAREISKALMSMNPGRKEDKGGALWSLWSRGSRNSSSCLSKSLTVRIRKSEEAMVTDKMIQDIFLDQSSIEIAYETATTIAASSQSYSLPGLRLTNEKIFFLSYAQTLCGADSSSQASKNIPMSHRLNTAVVNYRVFNRAFSCEPSPSECQVWS